MLTFRGVSFSVGDKVSLLMSYQGFPEGATGTIVDIEEDPNVTENSIVRVQVGILGPVLGTIYEREDFACFVYRLRKEVSSSPENNKELVIRKIKYLSNKWNKKMQKKGLPCLSNL